MHQINFPGEVFAHRRFHPVIPVIGPQVEIRAIRINWIAPISFQRQPRRFPSLGAAFQNIDWQARERGGFRCGKGSLRPIWRGNRDQPRARKRATLPIQAGANAPMRARNMPIAEINGAREVNHLHAALHTFRGEFFRRQAGQFHRRRFRAFRLPRPDGERTIQPIGQHHHLPAAQLPQPAGGHACARACIIHQHNARMAHRDPLIGGLHQLPTRRGTAAGHMPRRIFRRVAHIQHIGAARCIRLPARQIRTRAEDHTMPLGEGIRAGEGFRSTFRRALREARGLTAITGEAGQFPAHGAIAQRHHLIRNASTAERFSPHDGPRAPRAIHHHGRLGPVHKFTDAIDQFTARHIHRAGDGHAVEFFHRAAIQNHHIGAGINHGLQFLGINRGGFIMMLHPFAESLGRHIHARKRDIARRNPSRRAALQYRHIRAANPFQIGGEAACQPFPAIHANHARRKARQNGAGAELHARQPARIGPEKMRTAKLAILPRIQNGQFLPIADPALQAGRVNHARHGGISPWGPRWAP